jgi:hypothetical protein
MIHESPEPLIANFRRIEAPAVLGYNALGMV